MFENADGRTDAGVTGILIAHLGAFGSDELKKKKNMLVLSTLKEPLIQYTGVARGINL